MLRVVVESAKGLPKKKVGSPDPVTSVKFKGESLWEGADSCVCSEQSYLEWKDNKNLFQ